MPNGLIEGYEKILKIFFDDEHKKSISAVIYFTAGIIGVIAVLSLVMPFSCSADFLDGIVLKRNLSNSEFTLKFAFYMILVCMASGFVRRLVIYGFTNATNKIIRHVYTHAYAIDDVIDLQIYHTGTLFVSVEASVVYFWVLYKFVRLVYVFFANQTLKVIDKVCKEYPDLE